MLTQQNDDVNMWEGLFHITADFEGLTICGSGFSRGGSHLTPPHELSMSK